MKKQFIIITFIAACCLMICACGKTSQEEAAAQKTQTASAGSEDGQQELKEQDEILTKEIFAMDTYMTLSAYGEEAEEALEEAAEEITRLDALLAAEREDSEIGVLNKNGDGPVSEDTAYLIERAKTLHDETEGAFEITIYPVKKLWGFTSEEYRVPDPAALEKTLQLVDSGFIHLTDDQKKVMFDKAGVQIDLGGIAKGYASSRAAEIFEEHSVKGLINLGGNVQAVGGKPDGSDWRVAVRRPESTQDGAIPWLDESSEEAKAVEAEDFIGIVAAQDKAVITSGGYERYFEQDGKIYHHILDASTGYPSESDLISATVVSGDGTLADGLSTSVFVMGRERAQEYWEEHSDAFDMILMDQQGKLYATEGLKDSFTSGLEIHWIEK